MIVIASALTALAVWPAQRTISAQTTTTTLDYEYFKAKVEPIFLNKRPGHARCISCHGSGPPLRLQPLDPGATTWTEEESRKNFQTIQRVAFAGNARSRLLMHPLEESAGGDFYHSGGDNVHLIDPATNKVVGVINGIEVNHGAAVAPDGSRIYVSNEADSTLDVVDGKSLKVTNKVKLSGHPNNIAVAKDGKRVYVGIIQAPGGVDVIDTTTMTNLKTLPTQGSIHNAYVSPDGKYVVAGSIAGKTVNVFDAQTDERAWVLDMGLGVRPMAFATNPDGSTKWIFVQLTDFNGFAVVDFATHKEIRRIQNPDLPPGKQTVPEGSDPSHGMAVTADGKTLVVCSRLNNYLYSYSLPDLKNIGAAELTGKGAGWVTLTPDGKTAYVANPVTNDVSVVDVKTMKETTRIPVGYVPKRNTTGILQ